MIWSGLYRFERGMFIWEGRIYHQTHFATELIPLGAVLILASLMPVAWFEKLARRLTSRARNL